MDALYADRSGVRLLKCLCQTEEEKAVAWHSDARSLERQRIPHDSRFLRLRQVGPEVRAAFHRFGELVAELLKLAALLVFGSLISPQFLGEIPASGYLFALLVLVAVRPQGLRLGGLRPPDSEGGRGREVGSGAG